LGNPSHDIEDWLSPDEKLTSIFIPGKFSFRDGGGNPIPPPTKRHHFLFCQVLAALRV